ncbi:MAG: GNAT family N-acetyltransferase [Anaerolineae bacterium]|nr:GNAT family N-acetyltransferase [Anaerolineae bacterium]
MFEIFPLTIPAPIRAFLGDDPALTAYALGDLDPDLWPDSEFIGAFHADELVAVMLLYHGLHPTIITAFGEADGVRAIFEAASLPEEMYCLLPEQFGDLITDYYALHDPHHEWRMVLDPGQFATPDLSVTKRIEPDQAGILAALYQQATGPGEAIAAFSPAQIAQGRFYGVWIGDDLVATAGTHIWSPAESVVAIGNVFTRPDQRGQGYATVCTAAVVRDALDTAIKTVVLNVRQDNAPAIHVYEKLGFRRYHSFVEGPGLIRA